MLPSEPSRTTTRLSTRIVRNGSSASRTRGSRSGSSSSLAVANRIVPARCSWPDSLTKPFGRKNSNSVCSPLNSLLLLAFHVLDGHGDLFDHHLVAAGLEVRCAPLRRPRTLEVPPVDLVAGEVVHDDRAFLALDLAVHHRLVPLEQV